MNLTRLLRLMAPAIFPLMAANPEGDDLFGGQESDEGQSSGARDDGDGSDAGATGTHPAAGSAEDETSREAPPGDEEKAERPDWLPEQFWDPVKAAPRLEALNKSYTDARAELSRLQGKGKDKPLEKADDYVKDWKMPELGDDVPVERLGEVRPDDVLVMAVAEAARAEGLGPEAFNRMIGKLMGTVAQNMPEPVNIAEQRALLGGKEKAAKVSGAVRTWVSGMVGSDVSGLSEDEASALLGAVGKNALAMRAIAKIRASSGEQPIPMDSTETGSAMTPEEAYQLRGKKDEKGRVLYDQPGSDGDAHRAKVDRVFEQVFGTGRTGGRSGRTLPAGL